MYSVQIRQEGLIISTLYASETSLSSREEAEEIGFSLYLMQKERAEKLMKHLVGPNYPTSQKGDWVSVSLVRHSTYRPYPALSVESTIKVGTML